MSLRNQRSIEESQKAQFGEFCQKIPSEPWELNLLSDNKWLHDHGLVTIYKPQFPQLALTDPTILFLQTNTSSAQNTISEPTQSIPTETSKKSAFELSHIEKQGLKKRKHQWLIKTSELVHVEPISVIAPPPPSPLRSPSPTLVEKDTSPMPEHQTTPPRSPSPIQIDSDPSPHQSNPESTSSPTIHQTSSPSTTKPFPSIPTTLFSKLSFFPTEPNSFIPKELFSFFKLPADDPHFNTTDPNDLLTITGIHLK